MNGAVKGNTLWIASGTIQSTLSTKKIKAITKKILVGNFSVQVLGLETFLFLPIGGFRFLVKKWKLATKSKKFKYCHYSNHSIELDYESTVYRFESQHAHFVYYF